MKRTILTLLALACATLALAGAGKKAKTGSLQTVENKTCGYWIRYPKGSQLEHPSDCSLKIILPPFPAQQWISEASLTLSTAPAGQAVTAEAPDGEQVSTGSLVSGGMRFSKTIFVDAAMSHRYVTVLYEAQGKAHKYRLQGLLAAAVPDVMGLHVEHWDPVKSAEKIFDGLVLNFRPLE